MNLGATDLGSLELIIESEQGVKKRKDLVVVGDEYRNLCFVKDGYAVRYKLLRSGKRQILNVPFSQQVMADVLGLSVPHLNRVMQQLRADRLITSRSRLVELTDMASLQTLAQYQPLHLAPIPMPTTA